MRRINKPFVVIVIITIVALTFVAVGPVLYQVLTNRGIKVQSLSADGAVAASTDVNGHWEVVRGSGKNTSAVGFTFFEILPGEKRSTSGMTNDVNGSVNITNGELTDGEAIVDTTNIKTDVEKRDISVRRKILHTDQYPEATFKVNGPVDVSHLPDDGQVGSLKVPGTLTLHGTSKDISHEFDVLRTGDRMILSGDVPVNRLDYGVATPEFVAAQIAQDGELNIRLVFKKTD